MYVYIGLHMAYSTTLNVNISTILPPLIFVSYYGYKAWLLIEDC